MTERVKNILEHFVPIDIGFLFFFIFTIVSIIYLKAAYLQEEIWYIVKGSIIPVMREINSFSDTTGIFIKYKYLEYDHGGINIFLL